MAEDGKAMAFNMEGDYSDGEFGSDGEFYGRRKVRRKQTKEEQLYGVFMNDGHSRRPSAAPVRVTSGMFVSGGMEGGSATESKSDKKAEDLSQKEDVKVNEQPKYGFLARDSSSESDQDEDKKKLPKSFGSSRKKRASGAPLAPSGSSTAELKPESGPMDAGQYGVGAKFLKMMGYKGGGLGKDGAGIVNAVAPSTQYGREGLGTRETLENEDEKLGEDDHLVAKRSTAGERKASAPKKWQKASRQAAKTQPEVRPPEADDVDRNISIIDMRGATAKVVDDLGSALKERAIIQDEFLPELKQFIKLNLDLSTSEKNRLWERARAEEERQKSLLISVEKRKGKIEKATQKRARYAVLLEKLQELQDASNLEQVSQLASQMWKSYNEEFRKCNISEALVPVLIKMSEKESKAEVVTGVARAMRDVLSGDHYLRLLYWSFYKPMHRELLSPSFQSSSPEDTIKNIENWRPVLTNEMAELFFERALIPALERSAENWAEKTGVDPHHLLFPWLPVLGKKNIAALFSRLSHRFGRSLAARPWEEVLSAVTPWRDILKKDKFRSFTTKYVVPRLEERIKTGLVIDPNGNNELAVLDDLEDYTRDFGLEAGGQVLASAVLPQWLRVLRAWLSDPEADVTEVGKWYEEWTELLNEKMGAVSRQARAGQTVALELMRTRMRGQDVSSYHVKETLNARLRASAPQREEPDKPGRKRDGTTHPQTRRSSLREVVQQYAASNNLKFTSAQRTDRDGHTLYFFGGVLIYFDTVKELIFAQDRSTGTFEALSVTELMELAR
ncbi:hypothetical protein NDN08_004741 [Rhodosorus marinus]|uniref:G-patch domain-containing protein n=1 Tax=Rhodosorus marinus TaxID=101924 RepID=A0AAV8UNN5_9RHOD|nr:hypothetical protein NDN08_004741 [Rhodosorus marinus]